VDTDKKKDGSTLWGSWWWTFERLNLIKIDSYPELVNMAISQEDAMKRAQ
jgi:hypothetical protein